MKMQMIVLAEELIAMFSGVSTRFNGCRVEIMRGPELELASPDADGTAAVRCCRIGNDAASDKNGNCHFAELG